MTYTFDTFRAVLASLKPSVAQYRAGSIALKDARGTVKDVTGRLAKVRSKVRSGIAQAVAQAFMASLGPETCRSEVSYMFGKLPRPADLSEPLAILYGTSKGEKVTKPHRNAKVLASQWAEDNFQVTVETALKAVRKSATDPRKALTAYLHNILKTGDVTPRVASQCLRDAVKLVTDQQQQQQQQTPQMQKVA